MGDSLSSFCNLLINLFNNLENSTSVFYPVLIEAFSSYKMIKKKFHLSEVMQSHDQSAISVLPSILTFCVPWVFVSWLNACLRRVRKRGERRRKIVACIKKPWYTGKKNESSCFMEFCMIPVLSYTALKWVLGKSIT